MWVISRYHREALAPLIVKAEVAGMDHRVGPRSPG